MSTPATGAEQGISGTIQAISQPQRASCPCHPDGTCRSRRVLGTSVCLNRSSQQANSRRCCPKSLRISSYSLLLKPQC
ncbi:hypothetical protein CapIbe_000006 [Capra ibex]